MKKKDSGDGRTQFDRFKQAARELGCEDDPTRFAEIVRKVGTAKPPSRAKKATKSK